MIYEDIVEINSQTGDIRSGRYMFVDDVNSTLKDDWQVEHNSGASLAISQDNGWYEMTTGAVDDDEEEIDWGDICIFSNTKRPSFEIYLQSSQSSDTRIAFGLKESEAVGTDDYIKIETDSDIDSQWHLKASNGGTESTDQGSALTTNATAFKFQFTSDTAIEWYSASAFTSSGLPEWVLQGSGVTTNVPTASLQPFVKAQVRNNSGARTIKWDYVRLTQDRI